MRFGPIDRIVLFGGGQRTLNFLDAARDHFSVHVVSAPRLLTARLEEEERTVAEALTRRGIPFTSIERIDEFDTRKITDTTLGISFGAPWIFRTEFIGRFNGRLINGHSTRLPKNRGGASFSWQIMRGDRTGCHLFHCIDGGIDTGDIVMARPYTFPASCRTPAEYRAYHLATERKFFTDVIKKVRTNASFVLKKQDEAVSTYFPRLATDEHGWVDWSWGAGDIARFIAAFDRPYGGASTMLNGRRVRLRLATVARRDGIFHPFMSGLVYRKHAGAIWVAAHDGSVVVREILEHNGDSCDTRVGHRLMTPREHLDTARAYTALYDAKGLRPSS